MKTINKTNLQDGRVAITLYCEPDLASELVKLAKAKNIEIEESPELSQDTIEQLSNIKKDVHNSREIEKVIKMANKINTPDEVSKSNASLNKTTQDKLKQIINIKNGGE